MYDIANSKYKQLCEIRKVNSENLIVTEEEKQAEWEPKARRMIQLCLTDGIQDITAIEYKPLKQMTTMLLPGYKVMIIGPVKCRRGIILLEDGKYKEIGGEVESLLKPNALENVLARAIGEPENSDPYNDNGLSRAMNQNAQNDNFSNKDSLFDDDFEETVDLEAVTAIEQQNQKVESIQNRFGSTSNQKQTRETNEPLEDLLLEDIDFEPLENWLNNSLTKSVPSTSRMEINKFDERNNVMLAEETSTSTHDSRNKPSSSASSFNNKYASEFLSDFDFDDCEITVNTEKSRSQKDKNLPKSESKVYSSPLMPKSKLTTHNAPKEMKKNISIDALRKQNEKSVTSVSSAIQQTANTETINVLRDILSKPIIGRVHRIVRAQVKNHSTLKKEGKHWTVTAQIADHTSSIEVCFDSAILEKFIGFSVQEFSQKKKLAKLDSQVDSELRLNLRKAQHQIENLNALLKLELAQDKIPKIIDII
ncbi:recQ-mediated genome instability protein 1 isoform X2 [Anoplolepis gracilipes]